jgi:hypothetical protein
MARSCGGIFRWTGWSHGCPEHPLGQCRTSGSGGYAHANYSGTTTSQIYDPAVAARTSAQAAERTAALAANIKAEQTARLQTLTADVLRTHTVMPGKKLCGPTATGAASSRQNWFEDSKTGVYRWLLNARDKVAIPFSISREMMAERHFTHEFEFELPEEGEAAEWLRVTPPSSIYAGCVSSPVDFLRRTASFACHACRPCRSIVPTQFIRRKFARRPGVRRLSHGRRWHLHAELAAFRQSATAKRPASLQAFDIWRPKLDSNQRPPD